MRMPPLHCATCGRYGTVDDAMEAGGPCLDEECSGTIEFTFAGEYIRGGRAEEGEAGYWVVKLPEMVWSTDEVRQLSALVPHEIARCEMLEAIESEEP